MKCPWCKYVGSDFLYHLRGKHPEMVDEWMRDYANKVEHEMKEVIVEEPNHEEIIDIPSHTASITRRLEFDAGHRVHLHESKCANVHGHRYVVLLTCAAKNGLDDLGRVIDFSVIKQLVGGWIDDNLDHGMILFKDDPLSVVWKLWTSEQEACEVNQLENTGIGRQKHFIMDSNPTAENMSEMIFNKAVELLSQHDIEVKRVRLYETPNCFANFPG